MRGLESEVAASLSHPGIPPPCTTDAPPARAAGSRLTIYDVADEAGVAISTVSRVLNGSVEVFDATRGRVREAIRKLQFHLQRMARSLAKPRAASVAVALPYATSMFFVEMLKGVKDALRSLDIDLLLCNLGSSQPCATLQRFLIEQGHRRMSLAPRGSTLPLPA